MAGKKTKLKPEVVMLLLEHLSHGGTREGACGIAGISISTLRRWEREMPEFAEHVELAMLQGKARDEKMLEEHIRKGDRVALLHRMKMRNGRKPSETSERVNGVKEKMWSKEYQQVLEAIERLSPGQRKEVARAYREAEKSGRKRPGPGTD